jgi:hypothetical protein
MKVTTDLGDWSNLSRRLRWAFAALVTAALVLGFGLVIAGAPIGLALLAVLNVGVALQWLFTTRRPWWPGEPDDIIDRNFRQRLMLVVVLDAVAAVLVGVGVLRP